GCLCLANFALFVVTLSTIGGVGAERSAIEFEKKTHANNLEHKRVIDNNMIIMTHEVEKLRAELANAEKRARAAMVATAANPSKLTFLFVHLEVLT
ncbi:protein FLC EXPRESSOR-like, partial [Trifolium medium]|nr:protein FLC EXPRESSOR-like [Trifolium medium]